MIESVGASIRHWFVLRRLYRRSKRGRRFGWEFVDGGQVIGTLEYATPETLIQVFHFYRIQPENLDLSDCGLLLWRAGLTLRSRIVPAYATSDFLALDAGEASVSTRFLFVPWKEFRKLQSLPELPSQ